MNSPLETNAFRFWLKFNNIPNMDWYEIIEPIGWDGAEFVKEQNNKRHSRDVEYCALNKIEFQNCYGTVEQLNKVNVNIYGDQSDYLDMGLQWLLYLKKEFGWQMNVSFKITLDNLEFRELKLDVRDNDLTDGYNYFKCKLIEIGIVADYKRNFETKFNAFSDKNIKLQNITPMPTEKFLLKSIPLLQESSFISQNFNKNLIFYGGDAFIFNPAIQIENSGIENTLTSFESSDFIGDTADTPYVISVIQNRKIIKAKKKINNLKIDISALDFSFFTNIGIFSRTQITIAWGNTPINDWNKIDLFNSTSTSISLQNQNYNITIPLLEIGQTVWLYFSVTCANPLNNSTPVSNNQISISPNLKVKITANSVSLNSVILASKYYDLKKQANKFLNNLPLNAIDFNSNGKFDNQYIFNREMISQKVNKFTTDYKTVFESVAEVNSDYEITKEQIFIGNELDYYKKVEIGSFLINPEKNYSEDFVDKLQINKLVYEYESFESDRLKTGTNKSFHTKSEWLPPNTEVENKNENRFKLVRDPFLHQSIINIERNKPTTSTDDDDKINIIDSVQLPPNSFNEFSAFLLMRIINGNLEILNINSEGDSSEDSGINWLLLGLQINNNFIITQGQNQGTYTVISVTKSNLLLSLVSGTLNFEGDGFLTMKYFYVGINYMNRTTEGFTIAPKDFSNLRYSIKRNLKYFYGHIAGALQFVKLPFRNTFFKNNGDLETRLITENLSLVENAEISIQDLGEPILSGLEIKLTAVASFEQVINYLEAYKIDRGFSRFYDLQGKVIKGFVKTLKYNFKKAELNVVIEEMYEKDVLTIVTSLNIIFVNDVKYSISGFADWWKITNNYFVAYDKKNTPICKLTRYNLISLNGVIYNSQEELASALETL